MPTVTYRPLREEDFAAVLAVNERAFDDLVGRELPRPALEAAYGRYRRLLETDPGGAWVAERDGALVGAALGIVREGLWGLSLLIVDPPAQSAGAGRELLRLAWEHGNGARGRVILSSTDPRALRAYSRLGLDAHPCLAARGRPRAVLPPEVRPGSAADLPLTEAVDRAVRGAAHGGDITAMLDTGASLLVLPERGYAVLSGGRVRMCAAYDEESARTVLLGALARIAAAGEEAEVEWLSGRQQWAIRVCVETGLSLDADEGCVFVGGDVGPFAPYLPSGAYL
jgi:predicted N-acetyltransferase YhbS/acyl-coenzyme A thioesterase PaaI-like protein